MRATRLAGPASMAGLVAVVLTIVGSAQVAPRLLDSVPESILGGDNIPDLIVGPGTGAVATRLLNGVDGGDLGSGFPFGAGFGGGVRLAAGDINGDSITDIVAGMGPGGGLVRLFNGVNAAEVASGAPFGDGFGGGVAVAVGDVNGDGRLDIVVGQQSAGGTVRVFSGTDIALLIDISPFGRTYTGGVNVAAGDVTGDGRADLIVAQASGGLVAVINGATQAEIVSGAPYGPGVNGVHVATGDVNGDGRAEIIAGPGSGNGPVLVYDVNTRSILTSIVPYDAGLVGGVRVASGDITGDGRAEIVTVPGSGYRVSLRIYDGATYAALPTFDIYPPTFTGGAFVAVSAPTGIRFISPATTTFTMGQASTFDIRTTSAPLVSTISLTGVLPAGVIFTDNGNGTARLSGTPTGPGGTFPLTLTAVNGATPAETQSFTLRIDQAPAITSAASTTFGLGVPATFTVTTVGFPATTISMSGALPAGVTFTAHANGTATLAGTTAPGTAGTYPLTVTASNGVATPATQAFVLTVDPLPIFTSASAATFVIGVPSSFTVAAVASPPVTSIARAGALPAGITFTDHGNGTATLAGTPTNLGTSALGFTASNGLGQRTQNFTLTVALATNAQNDTYANGVGNTQFSVGAGTPATPAVVISGSVIGNDTGTAPLTAGPPSIGTTHGGVVAMHANGSFIYTPAAGFAGPSDSFTYTLTGAGGADTAVVTINLSGVIWYVNAAAGAGDGRSHNPFNTMTPAGIAAQPNQTIYVHAGAPAGTTTLKTGQTLWGAGATFSLNALTIPATAAPALQGTVTLANGVLLNALSVHGGAGAAIAASGLTGTETLNNVAIVGGVTGLTLTGLGGTLSMAGGSITGVTAGADVLIAGGTGTVNVAVPITNTGGRSIDIQNRTGGVVTFSGPVTDTGAGIFLNANAGSSIGFTGGLALATTVNPAFTATGGGTVTATQNNTSIVNTIATTDGIAVNVANTSIGNAGLTFRSVTAGTSSFSAGVGIVLDNTGVGGANGGLTVTGTGVAASGGIIRRKSGANGSVTAGVGIYLNNTKDVVLRWMQFSSFDNAAILGNGVVGFRLEDSVIDGASGNTPGLGEGPIVFGTPTGGNGLLGVGVIRNTLISGGVEHNVAVYNQSGALTLQVDGAPVAPDAVQRCQITNNSTAAGQDGLRLQFQGTASGTVTVAWCRFRNNRGTAIQAIARNSASLSMTADHSAFVHSDQGERGVVASNGGDAQMAAVVLNSTFSSLTGANVWVGQEAGNASAASLLRATVTSNAMTQVAGAAEPTVVARLSSTPGQVSRARILMHDNSIQSPVLEGIVVLTPDPLTTPAVDLTLTNNHVDIMTAAGPRSVTIEPTQAGVNLCAKIGVGPAGNLPYLGNVFHRIPTEPVGSPSRIAQGGGAIFRLERGAATLAATPLAVLQANDADLGPDVAQPLYDVAGTIAIVENGSCQVP